MISERKLANSYSSFWRIALPMGDTFIRRMNTQLIRFAPPLGNKLSPSRSALVSEVGFRLLSLGIENQVQRLAFSTIKSKGYNAIVDLSAKYIGNLTGEISAIGMTSEEDQRDSLEIANRLLAFFSPYALTNGLILSPAFRGCGIIDWCRGDVFAGTTLYELKTVERDFRLNDVRQLLVYCALNYASGQYPIDTVCLLNPRSGFHFKISLESLASALAGETPAELFSYIVNFVSTEIASS